MPATELHPQTMHTPGMLEQLFARNVKALMKAHPVLSSQAAVSRHAGMDQRTVGRIVNCEHAPTLVQIEKLARAFGLQPWQLFVPGLDPKDMPRHLLTESQDDAWRSLRVAAETIGKYKLTPSPRSGG